MLRTHRLWLPVFCWMGFIFLMSTSLGSSEHTSRIIVPLLKWLNPDISPRTIELTQTVVRKGGHLTEYAILALLTLRALNRSLRTSQTGRHCRAAGLALLIAAAYAATDEFHQSFVPGRTSSPYDVLIDASGAFAALGAATLWRRLPRPTDAMDPFRK